MNVQKGRKKERKKERKKGRRMDRIIRMGWNRLDSTYKKNNEH